METYVNCRIKSRRMKKIMFGFLVIAAGTLLLLFNMNILPQSYEHIFFSWEMLLIAIGLINIVSKDNWFVGCVLILIGGFFLSDSLIVLPVDISKLFWPILIITVGIFIVFKRAFKKDIIFHSTDNNYKTESGFINESNVFGGSKRRVSPGIFKGGKISCIFGGAEIDLTQSTLAEGKNVLEISAIFGGVSLLVPSDWVVHIEVNSILGGFADKRHIFKGDANGTRELFIKGSTIFGGGEIKSY